MCAQIGDKLIENADEIIYTSGSGSIGYETRKKVTRTVIECEYSERGDRKSVVFKSSPKIFNNLKNVLLTTKVELCNILGDDGCTGGSDFSLELRQLNKRLFYGAVNYCERTTGNLCGPIDGKISRLLRDFECN